MLKGVGKGIGGIFFKPPAGMQFTFISRTHQLRESSLELTFPGLWGLAGYPLTGIRRNLLESLGKCERSRVVKSRIAQGHEEMKASSAWERAEVVKKWALIEESLQKASRECRCHARPTGRHTNRDTMA